MLLRGGDFYVLKISGGVAGCFDMSRDTHLNTGADNFFYFPEISGSAVVLC